MLADDRRPDVVELLVDDRATHYWDGGRRLSTRYGDGEVAYDVYYLYGPGAEWGDAPEATGAPVTAYGEQLREALSRYLT